MGSECKPNKFHYDIAMSKRTRRPSDFKKADLQESYSAEEQSSKKVGNEAQENDDNNKKSLKQFIQGRSTLCQHFTEEEKQLQLIKQQDQEGLNKLKFKKLVSHYGKVLSDLIKLKRNPEAFRKKPVLQLTK